MLTGYSANLPNDALLDSGVLYVGATIIGVTKGAPKFEPNDEYVNLDFDGKHGPIKGLDRLFHGEPVISGTLLEFGDSATGNQIAKLIPGASSASAGSPNVTTLTPPAGGTFVSSYLSDVRLVFERAILSGTKKYVALYLPVGFVRKWDLQGQNKDGALINFEIVGRKDMASGTTADALYKVELREATPT